MNQLKSRAFFIINFLSICLFSLFGQELCFAAAPSFSPEPTSTTVPSYSPTPTSTTAPSFSPTPTSTGVPSFSPTPSLSPTYAPTATPTISTTPYETACGSAKNSESALTFPSSSWSMGDNPFPKEEPSIVQNPPAGTTSPTKVTGSIRTEKDSKKDDLSTFQLSSENSVPVSTNISSLQEEVTESYTKISGVRLQYLLEFYPDYIPFEHNGILLHLPSCFIQSLNLSAQDTLWIELIKTDLYSFTLSIRLNNIDIVEFPDAKIQLPLNNIKNYTLYYNNKKTEIPITYENKIARFTIYKAGEYSLKTSEENTMSLTTSFTHNSDYNNSKHEVIVIPAIAGITVISCLYILIKRKRSHNEKANLT